MEPLKPNKCFFCPNEVESGQSVLHPAHRPENPLRRKGVENKEDHTQYWEKGQTNKSKEKCDLLAHLP